MKPAPIALFTYNRPIHTQQTIEALLANELASQSDLIIFADGPKTPGDENVNSLRQYLNTITGFKSVTIKASETNLGLARSIINGVTETLRHSENVIVMEDDLVTSPYFLTYMNEALEKYQDCDEVISIHGYNYPIKRIPQETFFLRGADCWGWATWKRGWQFFNPDGAFLLAELKKNHLEYEFDFYGSHPYVKMLEDQIAGKNNSWAIRWYASAFLGNKLTLYPNETLVLNIGLDGSGTHCTSSGQQKQLLKTKRVALEKIPLQENSVARKLIAKHFNHEGSIIQKVLNKINLWK